MDFWSAIGVTAIFFIFGVVTLPFIIPYVLVKAIARPFNKKEEGKLSSLQVEMKKLDALYAD